MGIFSNSTPFDEQLDKATNQLNTETDWGVILALCDKVATTPNGPAIFAPAILAKLNNKIPHVSMQAITVLDACVNNCGKDFHKMVSSQSFVDGLREFLNRYKNPTVTRRLRYFIKKWSEEFKEDTHLSRFISFYYDLRGEGMDFPDTEDDNPSKRKVETTTNPDAVSSLQEAEDIAKAIEASLKEEKQKKGTAMSSTPQSSSLYPSFNNAGGVASATASSFAAAPAQRRKVKALYDFEAAEDNELTFKTGDFITILDDSDVNWWKGEGANGIGLFPSNFVTSDLSEDKEESVAQQKQTSVKFKETLEVKEVLRSEPVLSINEDLIDETLAALQSTDPETTTVDPERLVRDEESCLQMGKLIDNQLEDLDRKHLELTVLNEKILESLQMYDGLMKQSSLYSTPRFSTMSHSGHLPMMAGGYSQNPQYSAPYMAQQPLPVGAVPQQMGVSANDPGPGYNPMYHPPPTTSYAPPAGNQNMPPMDQQQQQQQGGVPQNTPYPSVRHPQDMMSYSSPAANVNYQDNSASPMMSQYQASMLGSTTTANYSTNQVASQPLM